ncbi:MAG: Holliday junction branch migration protein RuvA [Patescibacteria group bacterium]
MIGALTGRVLEIAGGTCLLDVGGVGYEVQVPLPALEELSRAADQVRLYTHLHLREDGAQLFGFLTQAEKKTFTRLVGVTGIGPKTALSLLSVLSVERIRQAVEAEDHRLLASVPGIGVKTAQRLVLELRGKLGEAAARPAAGEVRAGTETADAVEALVALGYPSPAAVQAVEAALAEDPARRAPTLVRAALKRLAR